MTRSRFLPFAALAVLFLLVAFGLSLSQPVDTAAILAFQEWRLRNPQGTRLAIWLTHAGSGAWLLPLAGLAVLWLLWWKERARAAMLAVAVLATRLSIDLVKLLVDRPRPAFDAHPVAVFSQSFPSGHAGNSMATYLALALFAAPERWRPAAVTGAVLLSAAIGATRPLLGVHWPSDVFAGWLFGAAVVLLTNGEFRSRRSAA